MKSNQRIFCLDLKDSKRHEISILHFAKAYAKLFGTKSFAKKSFSVAGTAHCILNCTSRTGDTHFRFHENSLPQGYICGIEGPRGSDPPET